MLKVWYLSISSCDSIDDWRRLLPHDELSRMDRFRRPSDRSVHLFGHVLKRLAVAKETGQNVEDLCFFYDQNGRPLVQGDNNISISLSHTDGMVAFAISTIGSVGVDVEVIRDIYDERLASLVLADEEVALLNRCEDSNLKFIELWTVKEAVAKAEGLGMKMDFRRIVVNEPVKNILGWNVVQGHPTSRHVSALAFPKVEAHISYTQLTVEELRLLR